LSQFPSRRAVCRTGPPYYKLWFMTCTREEEDRITYRHVPHVVIYCPSRGSDSVRSMG